jgi:hypothetical protein
MLANENEKSSRPRVRRTEFGREQEMNNSLEPSPPQSVWGDVRSDDSAEAAQRDLFEFLATSEAMAPPLATEVPADVVSDFQPAPSVAPDRPPDHVHGAMSGHDAPPAPEYRDEHSEACERAACSAAQAVDEATKENLRRLEATMSWLQKEARQLPRAPQLAPVEGLPAQARPAVSSAFDAIIDRSSLYRTVHGSTLQGTTVQGAPLPIWLREHEAPIRLPPPRRGRELWQRLVKFFWACAVAAPIAYVFAITTSPLHKHLFDIAGLASAVSSSLPMLYSGHAPSSGRELIAIAPTNSEVSSGAGKHAAAGEVAWVPIAAEGTGVPDVVAGLVVQPDIVTFDAPELPPQAAAADEPATATKNAAQSHFLLLPPLAGEGRGGGRGSEAIANVVPSRDSASPSLPSPASGGGNAQDVSGLTEQGKQFFEIGDLIAARILFMRAARAGDAAAAVAMGATYDPVVLAEHGVRGVAADRDKARAWYERAKDMGSSEGPRLLEMLANR